MRRRDFGLAASACAIAIVTLREASAQPSPVGRVELLIDGKPQKGLVELSAEMAGKTGAEKAAVVGKSFIEIKRNESLQLALTAVLRGGERVSFGAPSVPQSRWRFEGDGCLLVGGSALLTATASEACFGAGFPTLWVAFTNAEQTEPLALNKFFFQVLE